MGHAILEDPGEKTNAVRQVNLFLLKVQVGPGFQPVLIHWPWIVLDIEKVSYQLSDLREVCRGIIPFITTFDLTSYEVCRFLGHKLGVDASKKSWKNYIPDLIPITTWTTTETGNIGLLLPVYAMHAEVLFQSEWTWQKSHPQCSQWSHTPNGYRSTLWFRIKLICVTVSWVIWKNPLHKKAKKPVLHRTWQHVYAEKQEKRKMTQNSVDRFAHGQCSSGISLWSWSTKGKRWTWSQTRLWFWM